MGGENMDNYNIYVNQLELHDSFIYNKNIQGNSNIFTENDSCDIDDLIFLEEDWHLSER